MARAPVSKTGGWGFESLHSCQAGGSGTSRLGQFCAGRGPQMAASARIRT
jgi:hypothetical protein